MAKLTQLIAISELSAGQVGAIRNMVTNNLLSLAADQLKMPVANLVARDIRPYTDIKWATDDNSTDGIASTALTTDLWEFTADTSLPAAAGYLSCITSASRVMGDQEFMAIYGMRDGRMTIASPTAIDITMWKVVVGNSIKAIWDTEKLNAYKDSVVGITPSAVIIPQNVQWNIYGYMDGVGGSALSYYSLEGVIVEPRGKVVSP